MFDPVRNLLYVSSKTSNSVLVYDGTSGAFIRTFVVGNPSASPILDPDQPTGLAIDALGDLYVSSSADNLILRYAPDGTPLPSPGNTGATYATTAGLTAPGGLAFDPVSGDLFVTSYFNTNNANLSQIFRFQAPFLNNNPATPNPTAGAVVTGTGAGGSYTSNASRVGLNIPTNLAFGPDNNLYVVSNGNNSVESFQGTASAVARPPDQDLRRRRQLRHARGDRPGVRPDRRQPLRRRVQWRLRIPGVGDGREAQPARRAVHPDLR